MREDVDVLAKDLLAIPSGAITRDGIRHNIKVGVQYLAAWLDGTGCVPLYNLMEDAATAEICRAQLWQWLKHGAALSDGTRFGAELLDTLMNEELQALERTARAALYADSTLNTAAQLFRRLVIDESFEEFLTLPAYDLLP
jgi:malate synthase